MTPEEPVRSPGKDSLSTERDRLADLLHETLAQDLTFISMTARRTMNRAGAEEAMWEIAELADQMAASLRTILLGLKQPAEESLRDAVARLATPIARRSEARLVIQVPDAVPASLEEKVTLGRVVREAVANAVRHGRADSILVTAQRDRQGLRLAVEDDGSGFDPAAPRRLDAFGIDGMRNSIESIGGSLTISSRAGDGTRVVVELP